MTGSLLAHCSYAKNPTSTPGGSCRYAGQSVRALPVRILTIGRKRSKGVQLLVGDYIEKLNFYCSVNDIQIRSNPKNARDVKAQVEDEDSSVMQLIKPEDWVVMLDERGVDITSEEMAELVGDAGSSGSLRLSFCIGGPHGHGARLRERANLTIRLSSMVLNHQIALVVLLEQLYSCLESRNDLNFEGEIIYKAEDSRRHSASFIYIDLPKG